MVPQDHRTLGKAQWEDAKSEHHVAARLSMRAEVVGAQGSTEGGAGSAAGEVLTAKRHDFQGLVQE